MTNEDAGLLWDRFIAHLNRRSGFDNLNFLGDREMYKTIFIGAISTTEPPFREWCERMGAKVSRDAE